MVGEVHAVRALVHQDGDRGVGTGVEHVLRYFLHAEDRSGQRKRRKRAALADIRKIEQDFATGQSMRKSLLKVSCRIDGGDRRAKLVPGN